MADINTKVLFINDYVSKDTEKKLYCRIRMNHLSPWNMQKELEKSVDELSDPVYQHINKKKVDIFTGDVKEFKILINILSFKNEDFVQYHGEIDKYDVEKLKTDGGLVNGISVQLLYVWIYGLLIVGKYNGENYQFDLVDVDGDIYWIIKVLHFGLFKILFKIKVKSSDGVDMDEYFLDDLEKYYNEGIKYNQSKEQWKLKEIKYLNEIKMLKEKNEISKLRNSVKQMKNRINSYFLPLVNSLLKDKKDLMDKLDDNGEVFFSSKRKRDEPEEDIIEIISKQVEKDEGSGDELDWMQRERNKRLKLRDIREDEERNAELEKTKKETKTVMNTTKKMKTKPIKKDDFEDFPSSSDESVVFNTRDREEVIETQQDGNDEDLSIICEVKADVVSVFKDTTSEQPTQLDEDTDLSTEVSESSVTEVS